MSNQFSKIIKIYFSIIVFSIIFISVFFIPFYSNTDIVSSSFSDTPINKVISSTSGLCWPLPGYTRISSPFGYRGAPTAGASTFHGGIDLPAPPGTNIISAISGKVTFTGFMGSGGCTVVVQNDQYTVVFHHVNPNFLVHTGEQVTQGQIIAQVGPKNVYGFSNNQYRDENRKSYKWCNYWSTFTFHSKNRIEIYRPYDIVLIIKKNSLWRTLVLRYIYNLHIIFILFFKTKIFSKLI